MKPREEMQSYYTRFMGVVNKLRKCGEIVTGLQLNRILLRTVTRDYMGIVVYLQNKESLGSMTIQEVVGALRAFEADNLMDAEDDKGEQAMNASVTRENDENSELAMVAKWGQKGEAKDKGKYARNWKKQGGQGNNNYHGGEEGGVKCYQCGQAGHIARNCGKGAQDKGKGEITCYQCGARDTSPNSAPIKGNWYANCVSDQDIPRRRVGMGEPAVTEEV